MRVLKGGRSAIEAVEAAIKVLENKEITNAGFGSNLAIDGTVECDATVVDHFGRSGACGAVPSKIPLLRLFFSWFSNIHPPEYNHGLTKGTTDVKNPITLARVILESSNKPLSLRRVPPNLLVGDGARDFAREAGVELVGNDGLVSKNARDRYVRWRDDLSRAESRESPTASSGRGTTPPDLDHRKEHTNAILTGTWNEGQPDSPSGSPWHTPQNTRSPVLGTSLAATTPQSPPKLTSERSPLSFLGGSPSHKRQRVLPVVGDEYTNEYAAGGSTTRRPGGDDGTHPTPSHTPPTDGASDDRDHAPALHATHLPSHHKAPKSDRDANSKIQDHDRITDTVGAIAIDQSGRIAAGSSSGGIGMKHRGRVGPAALVGVGTAVIPADEHDAENISVAAVTSGTGEHMATTMASQRCAERLYQGTIRGLAGRDVSAEDEGAIISGFILDDFLGHPGVRESASPGAIGAMAVKKAPGGYYLYFAHNTESFALASMGSNDLSPACVMSRINEGGGSIAQGARKIRI